MTSINIKVAIYAMLAIAEAGENSEDLNVALDFIYNESEVTGLMRHPFVPSQPYIGIVEPQEYQRGAADLEAGNKVHNGIEKPKICYICRHVEAKHSKEGQQKDSAVKDDANHSEDLKLLEPQDISGSLNDTQNPGSLPVRLPRSEVAASFKKTF